MCIVVILHSSQIYMVTCVLTSTETKTHGEVYVYACKMIPCTKHTHTPNTQIHKTPSHHTQTPNKHMHRLTSRFSMRYRRLRTRSRILVRQFTGTCVYVNVWICIHTRIYIHIQAEVRACTHVNTCTNTK